MTFPGDDPLKTQAMLYRSIADGCVRKAEMADLMADPAKLAELSGKAP